jgi:undecaprenyl-diphosphatase
LQDRPSLIRGTLLAGLGASLAALLLFGWLAGYALRGETLAFDLQIREAVQRHGSPPLTVIMRVITSIGWPGSLFVISAFAVVRFVQNGDRHIAVLFVITVAGAEVLEQTLKLLFQRARPEAFFGLTSPNSFGFPSGHATVSFCFFGMLAAILTRRMAVRRRAMVWTAAAVLVLLIGFSRIYLGVHYASDVLAGYAAGALWVATTTAVYRMVRRPR